MSSIVTFYSYKGGVGRSMALANIAVLLARRGLKVLTVDWDLEAPGLERYFSYFDIKPGGPGLLRMFMEARDNGTADFKSFTTSFDCEAKHPITLLPSGREQDEAYSRNLEAFDWEEFFDKQGGHFVEHLRRQWRDEYDIVLIDSRTGLTDTGGICTIQLPDIVVAMFTANYQSLYGVRDVMRLAQKARQGLAYDRMPLSILPLPTRWGVHEFQETRVWLDRIAEAVQEFCEDWLPRTLRARDVIEAVKIPQADYFGFGEKLAVVEQGTADPQGMGFVYDKVAAFLASDFKNLSAMVGEQGLREASRAEEAGPVSEPPASTDYLYDIFVSYEYSMSEWVLEFVEALTKELVALGGAPKIFMDVREIRSTRPSDEQLQDVLTRSKVLVAILTPRYLASESALQEFVTFRERARQTGRRLLAPVVLRGDDLPNFAEEIQWGDLKTFSIPKASPRRRPAAWQREIMRLAVELNSMIVEAPPYDPQWGAQRDLTEAVKQQELEVLDIFRRVLGSEHPDTLASLNNLANTLSSMGELGHARALEEEVLAIRRRVLGPEHPDTLTSMSNLASTLEAQGDLPGARKLQEETLAIRRGVLGPEHPNTLQSMNNLAATLYKQGDFGGASRQFEEVLAVGRRVLGPEHPNTLQSMNNLASTLKAQGDLSGARKLQEDVLAVRRRVLGPEHPDTLNSMNNLAATLYMQGDFGGASRQFEEVLAISRRVLGPEHPNKTYSAWNLFRTLQDLGDGSAASAILKRDLHWLLDRDPATLGADQREIREYVAEEVKKTVDSG